MQLNDNADVSEQNNKNINIILISKNFFFYHVKQTNLTKRTNLLEQMKG